MRCDGTLIEDGYCSPPITWIVGEVNGLVLYEADSGKWISDEIAPGETVDAATDRAIRAVAPVKLVPEGERIAVMERDEALARLRTFATANREQSVTIAALLAENAELNRIRWELAGELHAAHDALGRRSSALTNPEPKKLTHDPFAVRGDDPRRMGPLA